MKKTLIASLASVLLFAGSAAPAFASMNFVGEGYKVPPACTADDHGIYELVGSSFIETGCWTPAAWNRSIVDASKRTHKFDFNASVTLKSGRVETCPFYWGCVIDPALLK